MLLLVWVVARHDSNRGLGIAEIDWLMRYVRRDEDEISGLIHHAFFYFLAIARLHPTLEEIDGRLETFVYVRFGRAPWRDDDLQHRDAFGTRSLTRDSGKDWNPCLCL